MRAVLFLGPMTAARHNPVLKAFRDRLVAASKLTLVALITTARKPPAILNPTARDGRTWPEADHGIASI